MLGNHGRGLTRALFTRPALAMARAGVTPNVLTVAGTVLSVSAAVLLLPQGHFVAGPLVLALVLVADSFDGILARATGRTSVFGAFLDSTMDRLADGAVFASLAAWAALRMEAGALRTVTLVAALSSVVLAGVVPYARARAEAVGVQASVGVAERTDRLVVALLATLAVGLGAPLWVLTLGLSYVCLASLVTVLQRVRAVAVQTAPTPSSAEPGLDGSPAPGTPGPVPGTAGTAADGRPS
ncbi:CDP-alcohol phosphatidyltransferase family protein [Actinomyces sp. 2119]|uniref:Phosphatidylinositol phosphate synthase n=1 Tax=Actinomyces lilanjuaniae TaxID=2321394 RepID=A0ABN5PS32_9ACTO|nr:MULTISPECIES: CDP-alcohol phosphatidyltransferase family protein [Actinomyces]AYD89737.1 CDP-alcohol phosphatidyltransferase family protein [Actinomyces lilanjuaniae]RJF44704.1 CDP-alcohol phosphatidyltransferase family protein [Actinomyces sp. 2119]